MQGRIIGIRHRIKKTKDGESKPTQVVIVWTEDEEEKRVRYGLETEQDELDFALGNFPISWRKIVKGEDLPILPVHHIRWRKIGPEEKRENFPQNMVRKDALAWVVIDSVSVKYDGLRKGDIVAVMMGGSGDMFTLKLSIEAMKKGAHVFGIYSYNLKKERGEGNKEDDAELLARLVQEKQDLFHEILPYKDQAMFNLSWCQKARDDAMRARIAASARLRQRFIGEIFRQDQTDISFSFEVGIRDRQINDTILQNLIDEEERTEKELERALEECPAWTDILSNVEGCGPKIGARLLSEIFDIRRFASDAKLKAFCGAHVRDGKFPRRRTGEVANWNPSARQALYLLGDQFNRRPKSVWGMKLRENKAKLRAKHPEVTLKENGKKQHTDGHIHRMATWKTLSKFVEWLYREMWKLEKAIIEIEQKEKKVG